jgi:hypothetical protein
VYPSLCVSAAAAAAVVYSARKFYHLIQFFTLMFSSTMLLLLLLLLHPMNISSLHPHDTQPDTIKKTFHRYYLQRERERTREC